MNRSIPSFSLILIMIVLIIIGVSLLPLLRIAYAPSPKQGNSLTISFGWEGASPRVIEQEVTSKIEGMVSSMKGIAGVSSVSGIGSGYVSVTLKKEANIESVRFELSSLLKQMAPKLPAGVSYPYLSESGGRVSMQRNKRLLSYEINADMQEDQIQDYINQHITPFLKQVEGVAAVQVSGTIPKYLDIAYDPEVLKSYDITPEIIREGVLRFLGQTRTIGHVENSTFNGAQNRISVLLSTSGKLDDLWTVPLVKTNNRIVYLSEVATLSYKDIPSGYFFRINGMNTIYLGIDVARDADVIEISENVRARIEELKSSLATGFYVTLTHDASQELKKEIDKLIRRTLLSLLILLLFVWIVSRSIRYLIIIAVTLAANVFIAVIFYYLLDLELHIFSFAGIAVSFGIIIDTSIVMADHYAYYRNRNVFIAILAALLTTIASLGIIFFMPEYIKNSLYDFASVIIINLVVSLVVALFFVPALIDRLSFSSATAVKRISVRRNVVKFSDKYKQCIRFMQKRKWIYITLCVLAFGLPVHLLPSRIEQQLIYADDGSVKQKELTWYQVCYNEVFGSSIYRNKLKKPVEIILGGSFRLFNTGSFSGNQASGGSMPRIYAVAKMPEGSTAAQLNETMIKMDNFLSEFEGIKRFETRVNSEEGVISIEFKDKYHNTNYPLHLRAKMISQILLIGGADWSVSGIIQEDFTNEIRPDYKSDHINIAGYNYEKLFQYAEEIVQLIQNNEQVANVEILNADGTSYGKNARVNEIYVQYDKEKLALYDINLVACYNVLEETLRLSELGTYRNYHGVKTPILLTSLQRDKFDVWNLMNSYLPVGDKQVVYSLLGKISQRKIERSIPKKDQEYSLEIAFNLSGPEQTKQIFWDETTARINQMLPIGYRLHSGGTLRFDGSNSYYWLIILIIIVIFFICSILFESLGRSLIIICLIPVSFIGVFLTFYFSGLSFEMGGFASLVLLSGLTVNAAIYILNEYNNQTKSRLDTGRSIDNRICIYVKSFNHKIIPVLLTILSTVLGLIPFLMDGKADYFWYTFAIGTISGLLFSLIALILVMPVFVPLKSKQIIR